MRAYPNAINAPPPSAWALLDILISAAVRRWRAETETFNVPWNESALALRPMAVRATVFDTVIERQVELEIRLQFVEGAGVSGRYNHDTDKSVELNVGVKPFRSYVRPSDEKLRDDVLTIVHHPFTHEYQHKRQDLLRMLPEQWPVHLRSELMYLDRPWEQDAFAADIAYRLTTTQPGTRRFTEARVRSYVLRELKKQHGTTTARETIVQMVMERLRDTGWLTE
jgi:hypothetical protein